MKVVGFCDVSVMMWLSKETGDNTPLMRPSYAQMAVRGKERLQDSNGGEMSATTCVDSSVVTEVCSKAASDLLHDKLSLRAGGVPVMNKLKKTSQRHHVTSRRLSGDCAASENLGIPSSAIAQTERHCTV